MNVVKVTTKKTEVKLVPISYSNTDYYNWGKNCKLLKYNLKQTTKIIKNCHIKQQDIDSFMNGYLNK